MQYNTKLTYIFRKFLTLLKFTFYRFVSLKMVHLHTLDGDAFALMYIYRVAQKNGTIFSVRLNFTKY